MGSDWGPGESELSALKSTDDAALLENTRKRYEAGHIYTRSGRLLLAVNPYRKLPLYTDELLQMYKSSLHPQSELAPHVYAVAGSAHMGMMQNSTSQSVVISGESGAGKTETAKILLQYLAEVSCSAGSDLHTRVIKTNPIMESFGCAKTVWNNNSSRFGKFLTLQFSATGRMLGASMKTYLLEKSRLTSQLPGEQNYHVLYTVAKGLSAHSRKEWGLPASSNVEDFKLLNVKKGDVEWDQFPCNFLELSGAMHVIPHLDSVQDSCWKVVMAILYLGNIEFSGKGEDDAVVSDKSVLAKVAKLLSCEPEQLEKAICTQNIKAGLDWISKPNTCEYAVNVKHALTKALYSRLFDFVVEAINDSLISGEEGRFFIGAVDIFGFECFPTNSLEQLCINFANEKLQRMFTEAVFESILAEYQKEGINVDAMTYEDNTKVVELIDASGTGILSLLSEECFFPSGSDASWLQKIKQAHAKHPNFIEERMDKTAFTISHYPGKVTYQSQGFLVKNKDPLSQDLLVLMQFSDDEFIASMFKEKQQDLLAGGHGVRRFKSAKFVGVIDSFRTSLNALVKTLSSTKTHFIRCVKPNMIKKPNAFVEDVMMRQLYTSGVVQAVQATRKGFPDHLLFSELIARYYIVLPQNAKSSDGKEGVKALLNSARVLEEQYRIGKTKVFLGVGVLDRLEQRRMEFIAAKAIAMQVIVRMYIAKRRLKEKRDAMERKRNAEAEAKRQEDEARMRREEEERLAREKEEEETRKKEEAEETERQKRFQRARQMSFERRSAKKKREVDDKKKNEEEATRIAAQATALSVKELDSERLYQYQQEVADGGGTDNAEMMNVAVVSDIGWKGGGAEPSAPQDDVWAQYDFKCAVSDVLEYAEYLGMDIKSDAHLLWIADEALQAPEPQGWEQRLDPKGGVYYYHPTTGMSLSQHPLDHHYQQFYLQMKAQYDAMYTGKGGNAAAPAGAPGASMAQQPIEMVPYVSPPLDEESKGKKGLFGMLARPASAKAPAKGGGPVEEMFELEVDLQRQADGLGIGLTLDNIIVEVEPGGSVASQGELQYGDQIVAVDSNSLEGRMLKDVIVPRKTHKLIVRYTRMSSQPPSPRRVRAKKLRQAEGAAPRRIEEIDVMIEREPASGRLGFGIDAMNTIVEVDPNGPVAGKLHVGDKIVAVDDTLLYFKRFVDTIDGSGKHKLRIARLRSAPEGGLKKGLKKDTKRRSSSGLGIPPVPHKGNGMPRAGAAPALREVRLNKETDVTKIGAVFHRSDDAFDKSFFNVEGSSVQPIIKKVDPGSMAEAGGLVPGDVVLSVNGISGLSNFQVVEMLRKGQGIFNLVVISGRQVQQTFSAGGSAGL